MTKSSKKYKKDYKRKTKKRFISGGDPIWEEIMVRLSSIDGMDSIDDFYKTTCKKGWSSRNDRLYDWSYKVYESCKKTIELIDTLDKANINKTDTHGNTLLHFVTLFKPKLSKTYSEEIIRKLLDKGANPNAQNNNNITPFHYALGVNKNESCINLYGNEYDIILRDRWVDLIKLLLEYNANPNIPDKNDETPFFWLFSTSNYIYPGDYPRKDSTHYSGVFGYIHSSQYNLETAIIISELLIENDGDIYSEGNFYNRTDSWIKKTVIDIVNYYETICNGTKYPSIYKDIHKPKLIKLYEEKQHYNRNNLSNHYGLYGLSFVTFIKKIKQSDVYKLLNNQLLDKQSDPSNEKKELLKIFNEISKTIKKDDDIEKIKKVDKIQIIFEKIPNLINVLEDKHRVEIDALNKLYTMIDIIMNNHKISQSNM